MKGLQEVRVRVGAVGGVLAEAPRDSRKKTGFRLRDWLKRRVDHLREDMTGLKTRIREAQTMFPHRPDCTR